MSTMESKSAFITRFDRIWMQARRVQLSQALCWSFLIALGGISLLAVLDYYWELPHFARLVLIVLIGVASLTVAVMLAVQSVKRWRRQATAAAIEQVFPQLGQRIRTTVQYSPLDSSALEHEGVATTMVAALEDDTIQRAQPLPLDAVIPWKALAVTSMLAAAVGLTLAGASATDWQWRAAAQRALLGDEPYTKLSVKPGDFTVRDGESAAIEVVVDGRIGKEVTLSMRPLGNPAGEWEVQTLMALVADPPLPQQAKYVVPLAHIRQPQEYRVAAGSTASSTYHIDVLYPLKLMKIQSTVQPPEYTRLPEAVTENGNIVGLVGSETILRAELDRAPQEAWLEVQDLNRPAKNPPPPERIPLKIAGVVLTAGFTLSSDKTYSIVAKSADGMELSDNAFRIRVRQDEAPQVWFESPSEALEVHTLAEVLMRIRVSDDFGLSRAGIMFEVNNEEEFPLLADDFTDAAKELQATGKLSPKTRATLEKVLPLEHFQLSERDSVMYFAFVEDTRPGSPQRAESDLRFIDLRPFRRTYRVFDEPDAQQQNQGPQFKSLEELIARQRYALNRTIQTARRFKQSTQTDLSGVDALIKFEGELAKSTRELAEGLEARGIDETELLYQAEAAMLGATDSLSAGKYETATLQERDALKYLIEGRDRLDIAIRKNPNRAQVAQMRQFDRQQQQKLRRPKTDEEEKREVAKRLEELADNEEFVYKTLSGVEVASNEKAKDATGAGASGTKPQDPMTAEENSKPSETKPETKPDAQAAGEKETNEPTKDGSQPDDKSGLAGSSKEESKPGEGQKPGDAEKPGAAGEKPGEKPDGSTADPTGKPPKGAAEQPAAKSASASADGKPDDNSKAGAGIAQASQDKTKAGRGGKMTDGKSEGEAGANPDGQSADGEGGEALSPQQIEDRQLDIAIESREIERLLGKLKGVTELSKERIAAAAKQAEEAAQDLGRGDTQTAQKSVEATSKQFRELAGQVKALLAQEQSERIAAAQQMAAKLAREQAAFVDRLVKPQEKSGAGDPPPGKKPAPGGSASQEPSKSQEKMPGMGAQAQDIAEQAKTLQDILGAAAQAADPADASSAKKVAELIQSMKLDELAQRLEQLPTQVGAGQLKDAQATAADGAERLEATAEQLAALQRSIIAPQVDELAKLESKLGGLEEKLDALETPTDITNWHVGANELVEQFEKAGISNELRQEFEAAMKAAGWGGSLRNKNWNWVRIAGGVYVSPTAYQAILRRLQDDVRNRMQELLLGDLAYSRDEPIPPQYQDWVDRFQQVLATEGKNRTRQKPVSPGK